MDSEIDDFDPILCDRNYPEVEAAFTNVKIVYLEGKHFFGKEKKMLQELDRSFYILVCPYFNLSLSQTILDRYGCEYRFNPVAYSKDKTTQLLYKKCEIEWFSNICDLVHAVGNTY